MSRNSRALRQVLNLKELENLSVASSWDHSLAFDAHDGCGGEVGEENYLFADELPGLVGEGDTGNDCSLFKAVKDRATDFVFMV